MGARLTASERLRRDAKAALRVARRRRRKGDHDGAAFARRQAQLWRRMAAVLEGDARDR